MKQSVRAWAFKSKYLRDFSMVDERQGGLHLFPATDQLPALSRALDEEFKAGLTTRLAATDGRADLWRKLYLWKVGCVFCTFINSERPDHLTIQPFVTPECVTQIAVVQHIRQSEAGGNRHWFRSFRGTAFLPDIYLAGKRVTFSSHAIERYGQRVLAYHAHPVNLLMSDFFQNVVTVLLLNDNRQALAIDAGGTVAVLPFEETATGFFILTMLSPHEVPHLAALIPRRRLHFHYGPDFTPPTVMRFDVDGLIQHLLECWRTKRLHDVPSPAMESIRKRTWTRAVQAVELMMRQRGLTEKTRMRFHDDVYGPTVLTDTPDVPPAAAAA